MFLPMLPWLLMMRAFFSEGDLEALYYLSDVRCVDKENLLGFTLEFHFDDNPFFTNAVLTKRYDTANIMDQVMGGWMDGLVG